MSDPRPALSQPAAEPPDAAPAEALAEVWELLDVLPDAAASPAMMATTMEMAAAPAPGGPHREAAPRGWRDALGWLPAATIVLASLVVGIAVGRATLPNPETGLLTYLPFVRHLDLLREAGSVAFLEELARRDYPVPRRLPPGQSPAAALADVEKFDAAVAAFRGLEQQDDGKDVLAARREEVLAMPERERRQLDKAADAFLRLSGTERRELIAVGRALADPSRQRLVDAARLWHQWIQLRDPADRRDVIDLGIAERVEWLDRMIRFDERMMEGREGMRQFFEREQWRRPQSGQPPQGKPDFMPPGPPRQGPPGGPGMQQRPRGPNGPGGPFGPRGPEPRGPEPRGPESQGGERRGPEPKPEPRGSEGEGRGRPPVSRAGQAGPGETRAEPR